MHEGRPHHGDRHSLHHGMGRGGKGLCPQTRTVPQAPREYLDKANPLQPTAENLTKGESLFQAQAQPTACKICHGASGNGMGMMAQGLAAIPRNFNCAETMKEVSDGQMFWTIKNGSLATGMPSYKFLDDNEIWELVLYLRGLSNAQ
ncbi:MAG: c-type cytochrome [Nitrospinae bacterium]|nr:c-type cytochrome [Nitrospinota bacterium]